MLHGRLPVDRGEPAIALEQGGGAGVAQAALRGHGELEAQALDGAEARRAQVAGLDLGPALFAQGGEQQFVQFVGAQAGVVPRALRDVPTLAPEVEHVLARSGAGDQAELVQGGAIDGPGLLPRAGIARPIE
jgi:hypothetical protein